MDQEHDVLVFEAIMESLFHDGFCEGVVELEAVDLRLVVTLARGVRPFERRVEKSESQRVNSVWRWRGPKQCASEEGLGRFCVRG